MLIRFKPQLVPTVTALVVVALCIGLGFWQLGRARDKSVIFNAVHDRAGLEPLALRAGLDAGHDAYRRATATGRFATDFQFLIDNQVHRGQPGYHVITPFQVSANGSWLLVNRGWIPWGEDRTFAPQIDTPSREITIAGLLVPPPAYGFSLERAADRANFQRVWQGWDLERFRRQSGLAVAPLVLRMAPGSDTGGFVREWPDYDDSWIGRHKAYALQWFMLAATTVVVFVVLTVRRAR